MIDPVIFFGFLVFDGFRTVHGEKLDQLIAVNPDFIVALFLGFIEDQLQAKVQVRFIDVVGVFRTAVAGPAKVTDDIPGLYDASFLQTFMVRVVFSQMGVVVITLFVETADAKTPAAILIPADGFYISGFDANDRCPYLAHHIMS